MRGNPKNMPLKLANYANNSSLKSESLFRQGVAFFSQGQFASAQTVLEQVLHIQSNHLDALNVLGIIAIQTKDFHRALGFFDKATRLAPTNPAFFGNRGNVHKELKHLDQAIADYTMAIKLKPDYAMAYLNQGIVFSDLKKFELALKSLDQAIIFKNADQNAYCQRGVVLMELQRYEEAVTNFEQAIKLKPNFSTAYSNRGNALKELNRYQQALSDYEKAIALKPDYAEAYANRGLVLQGLHLINDALVSFDQAISLKPDFLEAYCNKALALLVAGEFKQGWALYDWRWKSEKLKLKSFKTDKTKALSLDAESYQNILVWGEQGIGDQILYAGMLDELFKAVPSAQVLLDKRLLPLFQRSMPHGIFKDINTPSEDVEFDAHLPIADLGSYFRVSPEDFAKTKTSYLIADAERAKNIRSELIGQKKYVCGISWSSHTQKKIGAAKSVQLTDLLPLLSNQDIAFVSLQYGEVSQELAAFNRQHDVTIQECASVDNFNDLDGHAALIEACDFVVTISNTSAHMAGALGKQTYLLFSMGQGALWYWSNQIDGQSMWYPNLCIYQQTIPGQWADCVDTVCKDIEKNICQ